MISFLSPWMLGFLAVVPALWWLLRVMPPRPRVVEWPAFYFLKGLKTDVQTSARTSWWLLLLRALLVSCFILAMAGPVADRGEALPGAGGPVLIAIDNGWAAAAHWRERQAKAKDLLPRIARSERSVIFLPTAPAATDGQIHAAGPMGAAEAEKWIDRLTPYPWPSDYAAAKEGVREGVSHAVFLSDGVDGEGKSAFARALMEPGGLTFIDDDTVNTPYILRRDREKPGVFSFSVARLKRGADGEPLALRAFGDDGGALDEHAFSFPPGVGRTDIAWELPQELRFKVARVALRAPGMASATFVTDSRWRQRPVGIVSDPARKENKSFLNEVYYLRRALEDGGGISVDSPSALMKRPLSAIIWPDSAPVAPAERAVLAQWVEAGGFLIRFAGANLAASPDDALLPVTLRHGQRAMEGTMTWEKPEALGAIPEDAPLAGLSVPDDVTVTRQILAEPSPETFERTWLHLKDGTPLMTGGAFGAGTIVLIHTTAGPGWSNLCYSGLYVEALRRMVALSNGMTDNKAQTALPPLMLTDAFGDMQPPAAQALAAPVDPLKGFTPSPRSPPGLYGDSRAFQVFNLGDYLSPIEKQAAAPYGAEEDGYALSGERSLKADVLALALFFLLAETLATLYVRGVVSFPRRGVPVFFFLSFLLLSAPAARAEDADDRDLASGITLAYVETGDPDADQTSYNGLTGLARVLKARTTVDVKGVRGVDPSSDSLYYYPVLYWPMTEVQGDLPAAAARNLQSYMAEGGMILFDTRDAQFGDTSSPTPGTEKLRVLAKSLDIPALAPVEEGHILTKSFYLLSSFPGRFDGGKLWAEKEPDQSLDGITAVVIGSGDYAAAWSRDKRDVARFEISPGGERQREMAYRTGVNIVMTALAGNYKSDQVHVPYILERLGK